MARAASYGPLSQRRPKRRMMVHFDVRELKSDGVELPQDTLVDREVKEPGRIQGSPLRYAWGWTTT